jgi:hypothetical protein
MMLAERSRIRAERKSAEIAAEKKRRKVAAKRQEIAEWTVLGLVIVAVVGASVWGLIELIIWKAAH